MKKTFVIVFGILLLAVFTILWYLKRDTADPYQELNWGRFGGSCLSSDLPADDYGKEVQGCDYSVPSEEIPTFTKVDFDFKNNFEESSSLPLMASALIDLENDGVDEVFVGGGLMDADAIYRYDGDEFINVSSEISLPEKSDGVTYGAVSFDLDDNGYTDLILSGDYGVRWLRRSEDGFETIDLKVPLNSKSSAATTTIGDIDNDGDADIFLSAYIRKDQMEGQTIFKDPNYGASSILLQNNGDQSFTDVTKAYGLSYVHNTFQGVLVDVDKDGFLDLVVAYDTGEARTYKNEGGKKFVEMSNPLTGKYAYPMGIGVGDFNNDDQIDFFFSNTGSSVPSFLARGDLEEDDVFNSNWLLYRNDGGFSFSDVASEVKLTNFEFSWGAVFEDFNLDGRQDLAVAENYVAFPPHKVFKLPCRFFIQRPDGTFAAVEDQAGVVNKNYAITPLVSDFNLDGYPDMLYANLDGKVRAYLNEGGDKSYIAFRFEENAKHAGCKVKITLDDVSTLSDVYVIGEGLASDQTSTLTFGLGDQGKKPVSAEISYPGGDKKQITNPKINKVHMIR